MRVGRRLFIVAAALLPAASAARAQDKLAIGGYDTVAYFTVGKPLKGDANISQVWDGKR